MSIEESFRTIDTNESLFEINRPAFCKSRSNEYDFPERIVDHLKHLMTKFINEEIISSIETENDKNEQLNSDNSETYLITSASSNDSLNIMVPENVDKNCSTVIQCVISENTPSMKPHSLNNILEVFVEPFDRNEMSIILPQYSNGDSTYHCKEELQILKSTTFKMHQERMKRQLDKLRFKGAVVQTENIAEPSTNNFNDNIKSEKISCNKNHVNKLCRHNKNYCSHFQNNPANVENRFWLNEVVRLKSRGKFFKSDIINLSRSEYEFRKLDLNNTKQQQKLLYQSNLSLSDSNFQRNGNNHCRNITRKMSEDEYYNSEPLLLTNHSSKRGSNQSRFSNCYEMYNQNDNCNSRGNHSCSKQKMQQGKCRQSNQCGKPNCRPFQRCGCEPYSEPCPQPCSPCRICNKTDNESRPRENNCPETNDCGCGCVSSAPVECCQECRPETQCCSCSCSSSCSQDECSTATVCCETSVSSNCDDDCACPCPCRCPQFTQPQPYCLNSTYRMHYYEKGVPKFRRYKECDNLRLPLC